MTEPAKALVRMPVDLYAEIQRRAKEQGISANTLMVALLAGGVGFKLPKR